MAFKKFSNYLEQKQGMFLTLRNDQDYADVVFLYRSYDDMMVCDAHYIKTATHEGYVQCCMDDYHQCPACSFGQRGIRKDSKLFIPLFNLTTGKLEFWDRNTTFENYFTECTFKKYPNPSEYVFRVTRHGQPRDTNTRYSIIAQARNASYPYEKILADNNLTLPEGYELVCKSTTPDELTSWLNNQSSGPSELTDYNYTPVPRGSGNVVPPLATPYVPTEVYSAPPEELPAMDYVPEPPVESLPFDTEPMPTESTDSIDDVDF